MDLGPFLDFFQGPFFWALVFNLSHGRRLWLQQTSSSDFTMNVSKKEPRVTKKSVFKNLPKPALQIIRVLNYTLESDLFNKWKGILVKFVEYSIIYLIVSCGLGYGWILFLVSIWAFKDCQQKVCFFQNYYLFTFFLALITYITYVQLLH